MISLWVMDEWLMELSILIVGLITGTYLYSVYCFNYWKRKGIEQVEGKFPFGTLGDVIFVKYSLSELYLNLYKNNKGKRYVGYYALFQPHLLIRDLDLIKNILLKDFNAFVNRGVYSNEKDDPLTGHLFATEGERWKNLRSKLSPTFTRGKMKMMFNTMKQNADEMVEYGLRVNEKNGIINSKDLTIRYGLDVIMNVALGLKGNNFIEDHTDIRRMADMFFAPSFIQSTRIWLTIFCRNFAKLVRLRFAPIPVRQFFINVVKQNIDYRKKNNVERNDFMQLLTNMNRNNELEKKNEKLDEKDTEIQLTIQEMAAQAFVFVMAGFETTSATLSFCMYELALNKEIQNKLIEELDAIDGEISYDVINQLPYLEMVLNETLRKYPPLHTLQRENSRDYELPGGEILEKGTIVVVPVIGLHRDHELFKDPEKFDPERFSKEDIKNISPFSYMPFGDGPRTCIGARFARMQLKLGIYTILSRCSIDKCEKTQIPLKLQKNCFHLNPDGGLLLRMTERLR